MGDTRNMESAPVSDHDRTKALLAKAFKYADDVDYCWACDNHPSHGHAKDCELVGILEELGGVYFCAACEFHHPSDYSCNSAYSEQAYAESGGGDD